MIIRCEKCSTVYELDDTLLPPGGAPVQCSRCEHVFRAMPERKPEARLEVVRPLPDPEALAGGDPQRGSAHAEPEPSRDTDLEPFASEPLRPERHEPRPEPRLHEPEPEPTPYRGPSRVEVGPAPASARTGPTPSGVVGVTPDGRPIRKVPNPDLEGEDRSAPISAPARKAISYEVGPRKPQTGRWLIAGAIALLLGLGLLGGILAWRERQAARPPPVQVAVDPAAARVRQDGLALLARDDAASLEKGATLLAEAVRKEQSPLSHADRALGLALLSQEARDDADRLASRARAAADERGAAEQVGDVARARALAIDAETFQVGVVPARERAGRLASEAKAELDAIPPEKQRDPVVLRARAMALVAGGQRAEATRIARDASGQVRDGWLELAGILADLPENAGADEHARALDRLEKLAQAHPELVRARFMAARIRAGMGDNDGALAALDAVLRANPDHLEAKRLRGEIAALAAPVPEAPPPPTADLPAQEPAGGAPAENAGSQPRNDAAPAPTR